MSMVPVPRPETGIRPLPSIGPLDLYAALLTDARCLNSRNSRLHDVRVFARFLGREEDPATACALFVAGGRAKANALGMAFRHAEQVRGCGSGTINRRLSTLRRIARLARRFDLIEWAPDIDDLPTVTLKDTRGPSVEEWRAVFAFAVSRGDSPQSRRNIALLRLLHDSALRKSEALGIDLADLDLAGARALIKGKGYHDKAWVALSATCVGLIREWLETRGKAPGPLFVSHIRFDARLDAELNARIAELRAARLTWAKVADALNADGRTTNTGRSWNANRADDYHADIKRRAPFARMPEREINRILASFSDEAGLERVVKPHGLRHAAITRALDLNNGDVRKVQRFARHKKPETTLRYDDNRLDMAGDVTRQLGEDG